VYDKFLIQNLSLNPQTLQFWFCLYTILILLVILTINWFPYAEKRKAFKFRWSIIAVGVLLQAADYFYFKALQDPDALIMLLSAIKRSQILISVVVGGLLFKEKNKRKKLIPLVGIMIGVFLILYS
jgi:transporter family protein